MMFDLRPISTNNLFTFVQILVILGGFYFSWRSLNVATKSVETAARSLQVATNSAQAQVWNGIVEQGRELQFKGWDLFHQQDNEKQQELFWGLALAYYSAIYETGRILALPDNIVKVTDEELRELLRRDDVRAIWERIRHLHSDAFAKHVESVRGVRT